MLYFLHSTLVFSFYIDAILTLSTTNRNATFASFYTTYTDVYFSGHMADMCHLWSYFNFMMRCVNYFQTILKLIRYIYIQYITRNMHTVFALLCFVVVIHWLIFPYPSGLLHWHCGNLTIAPVPAKQSWWIWINTSCELIMNDCITTTKQSTTKPCAYFLGHTVYICYMLKQQTCYSVCMHVIQQYILWNDINQYGLIIISPTKWH